MEISSRLKNILLRVDMVNKKPCERLRIEKIKIIREFPRKQNFKNAIIRKINEL